MINSILQSKLNDSKTLTAASLTVIVEIAPSELISVMAGKLLSELGRTAPYAGYAPITDLEVNDIRRYLNTLIWMRVNHVNDIHDKTVSSYRKLYRYLAVPVLPYQLLLSIGKAFDKDYNLAFVPACSFTQDDILSPDEMDAISSIFRQFQGSVKVVFGLPNDSEGELDFMTMCHVKDEIVSYRKCHPVYGFLASFFKQKELNSITGMMCRIVYGYETDFKYQIDALFNAIDGPSKE